MADIIPLKPEAEASEPVTVSLPDGAKVGLERRGGYDVMWFESGKLNKEGHRERANMHADQVFIRCSDGRAFIAGGPMRHLSPAEAEMVKLLPLVKQVGVVKVGA